MILRSTLLDNFAEVKETSCECVLLLTRALPKSIHLNGPSSLIEPLTKIFAHQQKKIRIAAVKATGQISVFCYFQILKLVCRFVYLFHNFQ
jgi:hypothetical protein